MYRCCTQLRANSVSTPIVRTSSFRASARACPKANVNVDGLSVDCSRSQTSDHTEATSIPGVEVRDVSFTQ